MDLMNELKDIKCIVWDLDNTIWDGILSEDLEVNLKPNIKHILTELDSRGILHSIASKNDYDQAIKKLEEFEISHLFLFPEINWSAKSESISRIVKNLNISIDSMLFIDDQPFELDEVKSVHSKINCLPHSEYKNLLDRPYLTPRFITNDSKNRRKMYIENQKREEDENNYKGPKEEFLASLDLEFFISEAKEDDLRRAEELTIRTNQLNSTGITYDYDELNSYRLRDDHLLLVCELNDKYGSYGKIGLALIETAHDFWNVKLLLMSCRVISRGVGSILLKHIIEEAKRNKKTLRADFKITNRNKMMYMTYKFLNFHEIERSGDFIKFEHEYTFQPTPDYIKIVSE
ncbi:HAD-IIIC family phosphatase [Bacillus pseudomycoides]|uniref:HAD-IIIC family phosphatase n=1 Tax=Bacillus pseudomycoides TaxID=64104 RepID=UPI0026B9083F